MNRRAAYRIAMCLMTLVFILQGMCCGAAGETAEMALAASVACEGVAVSEKYTLRMTAADASCPMPGGKLGGTYDLSVNGPGNQSFPAMKFTAPGDYLYTVAQVAGKHALAVRYDATVYDLHVQVRQRGGKLELTAIMNRQGSDKKAAAAAFTNVYVTPVTVDHNPPVKKVVSGDKPKTAATFKFKFKAVSNTAGLSAMPMPEGSANGAREISTTAGVDKEFGAMTFTAPGQYVYQIAEINDAQSGYTYDKSVYSVTYTVQRQGDALTCARAVTKDGKAVTQAEYVFTNRYGETKTDSTKKGSPSSNHTETIRLNQPDAKTTRVAGTKVWEDNDNQSGTRPEAITVRLYANGEPVDAKPVWKGRSGNTWSFAFEKLPVTDNAGRAITYTVGEDAVPYYETSVDGTTIANRLEAREPAARTEIAGQKTWFDEDNAEGVRPESVTLHLLRDGVDVARTTAEASGGWRYTFGAQPADDGYGHAYTYTVREDAVKGYFPRYRDYDVYNTKLPPGTEKEDYDGFVDLLEPRLGAMTEEELEALMSLFGYEAPHTGLLPTGDEIPLWPIAFAAAGLLALAAAVVLGRKRREG